MVMLRLQYLWKLSWKSEFRPTLHGMVFGCLGLLLFTGCDLFDSTPGGGGGTPRLGRLTLVLQVGADGRNYQSAKLGKMAVTLSCIEVEMVSAKGEVVHDTITPQGSKISREPAYLSASATYPQELQLRYEISPSSRWNVSVRVVDTQDSIRYSGHLVVNDLNAFEYLDGCLPVEPRYAVIEGQFRLPAFIEAGSISGAAPSPHALYHTRLEILVEDNLLTESRPYSGEALPADNRFVWADPTLLAGAEGVRFFKPAVLPSDPPVVVSHDYGSVLNRGFLVSDYGYVEGDTVGVTPERLLYQGYVTMDLLSAKVSDDYAVAMAWQPSDVVTDSGGASGIDVHLGRAGKVVIQVVIPETVPI